MNWSFFLLLSLLMPVPQLPYSIDKLHGTSTPSPIGAGNGSGGDFGGACRPSRRRSCWPKSPLYFEVLIERHRYIRLTLLVISV